MERAKKWVIPTITGIAIGILISVATCGSAREREERKVNAFMECSDATGYQHIETCFEIVTKLYE